MCTFPSPRNPRVSLQLLYRLPILLSQRIIINLRTLPHSTPTENTSDTFALTRPRRSSSVPSMINGPPLEEGRIGAHFVSDTSNSMIPMTPYMRSTQAIVLYRKIFEESRCPS